MTAIALCASIPLAMAAHSYKTNGPMDAYTKSGLSPEQLMKLPAVFYAKALKDVPGRVLVIGKLEYPPAAPGSPAEPFSYHLGATYLYVTKGAMQLTLKGQQPKLIAQGQGAFIPAKTVLRVSSASATEPLSLMAFLINPAGAPILVIDSK